ncbi:MAG: hypothetical protein J6X44_06435, partial [Thermoguttaceae bacterium]|nr:hypothetical protein [Thermoguttaceae bacterium]
EGYGGGTTNHAWSGGGLTCIAQYAIGLRPLKPAFEEFVVAPNLGGLKKVDYSATTNFGKIDVHYDVNDSFFEAKIVVPHGITGWFCVPSGFENQNPIDLIPGSAENDRIAKDIPVVQWVELKEGENILTFPKTK